MQTVEGVAGNQTQHLQGVPRANPADSADESTINHGGAQPATPLRRLLSDREAAQVLGVGFRTFCELLATADWLPTPIVFGPKLRRWDVDELLQAARTKAPREARGVRPQPAELRRARIERMKATGNAGATA